MLETLLQITTIFLFAALPFLASWIANGGRREDIWIMAGGSFLLTAILSLLYALFA